MQKFISPQNMYIMHICWLRDALCSQHFEYGSNYGHVTFRTQKLIVEPEAVSQMKKVMIYGSLLVYLL